MTMHRLSAGNGFRYLLNTTATSDVERTPGLPLVEYYAESGNPHGRWVGGGMSGLGEGQGFPIGTEVSEAAMTAVFGHAADPLTGPHLVGRFGRGPGRRRSPPVRHGGL
jgi:TrwC relaxase